MTKEEFQEAVLGFITDNPTGIRFLAKNCKCAPGTITRWAHGHSYPAYVAMEWVVSWTK